MSSQIEKSIAIVFFLTHTTTAQAANYMLRAPGMTWNVEWRITPPAREGLMADDHALVTDCDVMR